MKCVASIASSMTSPQNHPAPSSGNKLGANLTSGKVVVSYPTGNANVTAVVDALHEQELLAAFFTCVVWRPESPLAGLIPGSLRAMLERRARVQLPPDLVRTRPLRELIRSVLIRAGKRR